MEFPDILPVECEVRDLSLAVKPVPKTWSICRRRDVKAPVTSILKNVSFNIGAGSFIAIMGASGSGKVILKFVVNTNWKTCLLDILAGRKFGKGWEICGTVDFNQCPIEKIQHAYLLQDDNLIGRHY
jgi:ABC-type phosphate/phosphonate transport system ATPase subunit